MDVVPAVEDHGRGEGEEERGHGGPGRAQETSRPDVGHDEDDAEHGGDEAQRDLVDLHVSAFPPEPGGKEGQKVEGRPVVLGGVVGVAPALEQGPELVRVNRLVGVHRARREIRQAQSRGQQDGDEKDPPREQGWIDSRTSGSLERLDVTTTRSSARIWRKSLGGQPCVGRLQPAAVSS